RGGRVPPRLHARTPAAERDLHLRWGEPPLGVDPRAPRWTAVRWRGLLLAALGLCALSPALAEVTKTCPRDGNLLAYMNCGAGQGAFAENTQLTEKLIARKPYTASAHQTISEGEQS